MSYTLQKIVWVPRNLRQAPCQSFGFGRNYKWLFINTLPVSCGGAFPSRAVPGVFSHVGQRLFPRHPEAIRGSGGPGCEPWRRCGYDGCGLRSSCWRSTDMRRSREGGGKTCKMSPAFAARVGVGTPKRDRDGVDLWNLLALADGGVRQAIRLGIILSTDVRDRKFKRAR